MEIIVGVFSGVTFALIAVIVILTSLLMMWKREDENEKENIELKKELEKKDNEINGLKDTIKYLENRIDELKKERVLK